MPVGILVMQWNQRSGIEILSEYPENIDRKLTQNSLLQVYNMHQFTRKAGNTSMSNDSISFASYYDGPETGYFVLLILNILETPEDYEQKLQELSKGILNNIKNKNYVHLLPGILQSLSEIGHIEFESEE
jgi:hypothetical protein